MAILAIDTSCDETSAAVTEGRRVLSNVIYSQVLIHKQWGGVVPSLAKRAHEERIGWVIDETMKRYKKATGSGWDTINAIAVTYGPGLAIALEVGLRTARELATAHNKPLIPVNHMEGHLYSSFVQNSQGRPAYGFQFPYLSLLVSGGHTELVVFRDHLNYEVIGRTLDDAAGEALDKAAKLLGLGYPGGAVIERLAAEAGNTDPFVFPRPMAKSADLHFSFSGLKTSFLYFVRNLPEDQRTTRLGDLASSFQEAVFSSLLMKTKAAMKQTGINRLSTGGGVMANRYLRKKLRVLAAQAGGSVIFPPYKYLAGDNAAMIGAAANYRLERKLFADPAGVDRVPRASL